MSKRKWTDEEIFEYRKTHGKMFYSNSEDARLLVPKGIGYGWTFNFANPYSWAFMAGIGAVIAISIVATMGPKETSAF